MQWAWSASVAVSVATMSRAIRRLGITLKKVLHASEQDSVRRAAWREALDLYDPAALVFVEESGTNLAMTPSSGRAPRGERVVGTVPCNHGPNTTLVAALSLDGVTAAMTVEGAMDRCAFDAFVAQVLVPRLHPGQVVVWDNLSVHKSAEAPRVIEAAGCHLLWLPPYSPDFTPIEQAFSKFKTALRRTGARTRDALDDAITAGLSTITAADAPGWFAHCGYPIPAHLL
jgi:transposase